MLRSTTVRWAVGAGIMLLLQSIVVAGTFWYGTSRHAESEMRSSLTGDCRELSQRDLPSLADVVNDRINGDLHRNGYVGLFDESRQVLVANFLSFPEHLPVDGHAYRTVVVRAAPPGPSSDTMIAVACQTIGGQILVLGQDLDELGHIRRLVLHGLTLALIPAVLIAFLGGTILSLRVQRQIGVIEIVTRHVMAGSLHERVPIPSINDAFGRLCMSVNLMLDRIETLVAELRGTGDDIAHQLKTPLTRLRAGLERSAHSAGDVAGFRDAIEHAMHDIDQTLDVIAAMLRIREIELSARRSRFRVLSLNRIVQDALELYGATAEARNVTLISQADSEALVVGDANLLMEAFSNLIDNAIKFSPIGGRVIISVDKRLQGTIELSVQDEGPGLLPADRPKVVQRFYRSERDRRIAGVGLGLSLVDAILKVHGFALRFEDARPGCIAIITCPLFDNAAQSKDALRDGFS